MVEAQEAVEAAQAAMETAVTLAETAPTVEAATAVVADKTEVLAQAQAAVDAQEVVVAAAVTVEEAAQAVLDARAQFPDSSLADLYDPNTMPPVLVKAHQQLDKAVDLCYRPQLFPSEAKRIEYLFELYEKYTGGLFQPEKKGKKKKIDTVTLGKN